MSGGWFWTAWPSGDLDWAALSEDIDPRWLWAEATGRKGLASPGQTKKVPVSFLATEGIQTTVLDGDAALKRMRAGGAQAGWPLDVGDGVPFVTGFGTDPKPVLAVIDQGLPVFHPCVRGRIKVLSLPSPAPDARTGKLHREWSGGQLHDLWSALHDEGLAYRHLGLEPALQRSLTHGAHVLGLLAAPGDLQDAASQAEIAAVELPRPVFEDSSATGMGPHVLAALDFIRKQVPNDRPLVVNLSYGSQGGPHNGSTLVERGIDQFVETRSKDAPTAVVVPAGNARRAEAHACWDGLGKVAELDWWVMPDDESDSFLELWYPNKKGVEINVSLRSPDGFGLALSVGLREQQVAWRDGRVRAGVFHRPHGVVPGDQCVVLIALGPSAGLRGLGAMAGLWRVRVENTGKVKVPVDAWLERDDAPLGSRRRTPASRLVPVSGFELRRQDTQNSMAWGKRSLVVGALGVAWRPDEPPVLRTTPQPGHHPDSGADQVDAWRLVDSGLHPAGVRSIGTRDGQTRRLSGTSMAAALYARDLCNALVGLKFTNVTAKGVPEKGLAKARRAGTPPFPDPSSPG